MAPTDSDNVSHAGTLIITQSRYPSEALLDSSDFAQFSRVLSRGTCFFAAADHDVSVFRLESYIVD